MYTINKKFHKGFNSLEIINKEIGLKSSISLDEGARLKSLVINNKKLIKEDNNFNYKYSFASAILFPFTNRIYKGIYEFKGQEYVLNCNESNAANALHGLVYNKPFQLKKIKTKKSSVSISLFYEEKNKAKGFPFTYCINVKYTFSEKGMSLQLKVKNSSLVSFPYTVGWHPYFYSSNLSESCIEFQEKILPNKILKRTLKLEDKKLDDCYCLANSPVLLKTPDYKIVIKSSSKKSFLQVYTPLHRKSIAIEPQTGISNSFNTKEGLQVLNPKEQYSINWNIQLI